MLTRLAHFVGSDIYCTVARTVSKAVVKLGEPPMLVANAPAVIGPSMDGVLINPLLN